METLNVPRYEVDDSPSDTPEYLAMKDLWKHVATQAIDDLSPVIRKGKFNYQFRTRAIRWFKSPAYGPGTWRWICDFMGWDAKKVGARILSNDAGETDWHWDIYQKNIWQAAYEQPRHKQRRVYKPGRDKPGEGQPMR